MILPLDLPIKVWIGMTRRVITMTSKPGGPKRLSKIATITRKAKGAKKEVARENALDSIVLKSFDSKFIILPSSWDFIVYWEILESFENMRNTS